LPWLAPFLTLPRLARRTPSLTNAPDASGSLVSVIVPARNEAVTIETVVSSILGSAYHPLELIVVNDQSTDQTSEILERLSDPRLRVLQGEALPHGWYGKAWACHQGYRAARGDVLLFTDADTKHHPDLLPRAVGALRETQSALLTVSPLQRCVTLWERLVMPQIWFLLALRYHPEAVNRAAQPRDVIANGQFILTTREAYESAGTHAAVRQEVAEDLALAQTYLRHGLKLHFAFAERLMETRMYRSLGELVEGWSKNIYLGGRRSFPHEPVLRSLVPVMLTTAMVFWLFPPTWLVISILSHNPVAASTIAIALSAAFWMLICYGMEIPAVYGLGYPLGAAMTLYIVLRSTWRGRTTVEWRGRVYDRAEEKNVR
jgi:chlorobactene glucosyltransferase